MMFDFKDWYDRVAEQMPDNCVCVEVGVANGDSALYLAERFFELQKQFKLYMVDNMDYGGYDQMKTIYQNIIKSGLGEYIEVIPYDSVSASEKFNDGSIDFVFLDSSHEYQETKDSIRSWYPKLKDDGILSGHDYFLYADDVGKAVDEMLPRIIKRETIDTPEQYNEFEEEQFLITEDTGNHYGIWVVRKRFYYDIR